MAMTYYTIIYEHHSSPGPLREWTTAAISSYDAKRKFYAVHRGRGFVIVSVDVARDGL